MADVSADDIHIDNLGKHSRMTFLNLLKGKDVLVSLPKASGKFVIFQSFPIIVDVV